MRKIITEPIRRIDEIIYSRDLKVAICDTDTKLEKYILSPEIEKIDIPKNVIVGKAFDDTIENIYIDKETLDKNPDFKSLYEGKFKECKSLDDLLSEGKSLKEISNIYKTCNIEK